MLSESVWFDPGASESAQFRDFEYDGADRITRVDEPYAAFTTTAYSTNKDGSVTVTDPLLRAKISYTDGLGRVVLITEPDTTSDTIYSYDTLDRLTGVQDSSAATTQNAVFESDSLGRVRKSCDFDIDSSVCRVLTYTTDGLLATETNARGQMMTLAYDLVGRIKTKTTAEGEITTWTYDEAGHGSSEGQLTTVQYETGKQSFDWDIMSFQTGIEWCVGTGAGETCRAIGQNYQFSRLNTRTYPDAAGNPAETLTYGYDDSGLVSSVSGLVESMTHDARGRVTNVTYANGPMGDRVALVQAYDYPKDVITAANVTGPSSTAVYNATYPLYDSVLKIQQLRSTTHPKMNMDFGYDTNFDRLTTVTPSGAGDQDQDFSYDSIGRMLTLSPDGIATYNYEYVNTGDHPHAVSKVTNASDPDDNKEYEYDADGNLRKVFTTTPDCVVVHRLHYWDSESRLRWVSNGTETTSYRYDYAGQRIEKKGPSAKVQYFGSFMEIRDPGPSSKYVKFYYVEGLMIALEEDAAKQWAHHDHLGSIRALTDVNGVRTVGYEYAVYGEQIQEFGGTSTNTRSFGGHFRDDESSLLYMGARYHDPTLARFIQPDPIVADLFDPQSWNRYSFVRNNPLNRVDPTGAADKEAQDDDGVARGGGAIAVGGVPESQGNSNAGFPDNDPLPNSVKERLGSYFPDTDLDEVRVKTGLPWYVPGKNPATGGTNIAYTQGNTLYFEPGYYDTESASGLALIGHELTHVRQQNEHGLWTYRRRYLFAGEFRQGIEDEAGEVQLEIFRDLRSLGLPR